jgi:hypothetical protein
VTRLNVDEPFQRRPSGLLVPSSARLPTTVQNEDNPAAFPAAHGRAASVVIDDDIIPEAVRRLPRDSRGYPIPFIVDHDVDGQGTPDFRTIDEDRWTDCAVDRLCEVCGEKLTYWMVFIGGVTACTNRRFLDPPMHRECAEFARRVCPYLVMPGYKYSKRTAPEGYKDFDFVSAERPEIMYMYITRDYQIIAEELPRENPLVQKREVYLFQPAPAKELVSFP